MYQEGFFSVSLCPLSCPLNEPGVIGVELISLQPWCEMGCSTKGAAIKLPILR